jgi:UDPglucose 6-dehydrogenase
MSSKAAEITKLSINSFISMKISFVNMLGDLLVKSKLDGEINSILHSIGSDSRIGTKSMKYGFGYGGHSLPRDTKTLTDYLNNHNVDTSLILSVKESNENHSKFLKEYYINQNPNKDIPFVFNNIGYKENIGDLTNSQQYKLCIELLDEGYNIIVIDDHQFSSKFQDLCVSYKNKLKFYKSGTNPDGYKINK